MRCFGVGMLVVDMLRDRRVLAPDLVADAAVVAFAKGNVVGEGH